MSLAAPSLAERVGADRSKQQFCDAVAAIMRQTGRAPVFVSDKDGTLTPPRRPLSTEMAAALHGLATRTVVAVISGGEAYRLREEVFAPLVAASDAPLLDFYLIAENGALTQRANGEALDLIECFDLKAHLGAAQFGVVLSIVEDARVRFGIGDNPLHRHVVADGAQIKLSALGNLDDDDARRVFDPGGTRRGGWAVYVRQRVNEAGLADESGPLVDVIVSGTSSINILARGVNKGRAVSRLAERHGRDAREVIYFGDSFGANGNDRCVLAHVRTAVNFGLDVEASGGAAVLNASTKGPEAVRDYFELARLALG